MTHNPQVLNATNEEKAEAFEWLRSLAIGGGTHWRKYAVIFDEWARLSHLHVGTRPEGSFVKDAERYRFLRSPLSAEKHVGMWDTLLSIYTTNEAFDAAVDAAMQERVPQTRSHGGE